MFLLILEPDPAAMRDVARNCIHGVDRNPMAVELDNLWPGLAGKLLLRRIDHSAIFLFIAATYTPLITQAHEAPSPALIVAIWRAGGDRSDLEVGLSSGEKQNNSLGVTRMLRDG
jgi:hypothetical protein